MASLAGPAVVVTRTSIRSPPPPPTHGQDTSPSDLCGGGVHNQSCLYFLTVGGFYGVIVLGIYVCLRRGNIVFACLLFFFVFLPAAFKISWEKFQNWQARKRALHRNAATVDRLNRHGTEERGSERRDSGTDRPAVGAAYTEAVTYHVQRRSPPPKYGDIHPADPPPSYAEAVEIYGMPDDIDGMAESQETDQSNVTIQPGSSGTPAVDL